jgi:predicted NodU family carbamoyl transferase
MTLRSLQKGDISIEGGAYFPHSLGIFYQALTQYLGFPDYGDEHNVMDVAVLGWSQGRMEWGPRAPGNRSILCYPRRSDMKAIFERQDHEAGAFSPPSPHPCSPKQWRMV